MNKLIVNYTAPNPETLKNLVLYYENSKFIFNEPDSNINWLIDAKEELKKYKIKNIFLDKSFSTFMEDYEKCEIDLPDYVHKLYNDIQYYTVISY